MARRSLVRPLFEGPIDVVGDVHGEIDALRSLLHGLGYLDGAHPEGRRLVFVGDLTDRGPDSPAVVRLVKDLVQSGQAQCVLGNHDLNLRLCHLASKEPDDRHPFGERRKHDNHWFFGEESSLDKSGIPTPAVLADDETRRWILEFLASLPLVLEREDVRVVHACWHDDMVEASREWSDVIALYTSAHQAIEQALLAPEPGQPSPDAIDQGLSRQNRNPVKVITSGLEYRTEVPFEAGGKLRHERRVEWWRDYDATPTCVFGHYADLGWETARSPRAVCVDFGVAGRYRERKLTSAEDYSGRLGALRLPERQVFTDTISRR